VLHRVFNALGNLPLRLSFWTEVALGALVACIPFGLSLLMAPNHRSPYLLSYPAVILSAWVLGLSGAIACAVVSGCGIEYFIFATHRINLAPDSSGWLFRECVFIVGSIFVGSLTRIAAREREEAKTLKLEHELTLSRTESYLAQEHARASELARENQVRIEMALDGANAGVWEWDIPSNHEIWSSGFYRLHGIDPSLQAGNELWRRSVHPDDVEQAERELELAVQRKDSCYTEYRVVLPDGTIRWIACQGVTQLDDAGEVRGITGYCGDVTRRRLTDQALLKTEKLAVAGRLSAAIAHEINNPLNAAMGLLFLLKDSGLTQEQTQYVEETGQQLERVVEITRQTLQMSRSTSKFVAVKPAELVSATVRLLSPKLHLAKIAFDTETEGNAEVLGSPGELQQVLTNLINNSIEAMPQGGRLRARVRPSWHWKERTLRGVRITIADSGCGMPAEVYRHMLEPFFTTKEETGTGLGMWVVSELLSKHHGELNIRSSMRPAHHGTTCSIFIPFTLAGLSCLDLRR